MALKATHCNPGGCLDWSKWSWRAFLCFGEPDQDVDCICTRRTCYEQRQLDSKFDPGRATRLVRPICEQAGGICAVRLDGWCPDGGDTLDWQQRISLVARSVRANRHSRRRLQRCSLLRADEARPDPRESAQLRSARSLQELEAKPGSAEDRHGEYAATRSWLAWAKQRSGHELAALWDIVRSTKRVTKANGPNYEASAACEWHKRPSPELPKAYGPANVIG